MYVCHVTTNRIKRTNKQCLYFYFTFYLLRRHLIYLELFFEILGITNNKILQIRYAKNLVLQNLNLVFDKSQRFSSEIPSFSFELFVRIKINPSKTLLYICHVIAICFVCYLLCRRVMFSY